MPFFTTELVTTPEGFEALREPWNELVASMEHPEVFYLWEWNFHYFRHYRKNDRLLALLRLPSQTSRQAPGRRAPGPPA